MTRSVTCPSISIIMTPPDYVLKGICSKHHCIAKDGSIVFHALYPGAHSCTRCSSLKSKVRNASPSIPPQECYNFLIEVIHAIVVQKLIILDIIA